jgi:hypothetical protein
MASFNLFTGTAGVSPAPSAASARVLSQKDRSPNATLALRARGRRDACAPSSNVFQSRRRLV